MTKNVNLIDWIVRQRMDGAIRRIDEARKELTSRAPSEIGYKHREEKKKRKNKRAPRQQERLTARSKRPPMFEDRTDICPTYFSSALLADFTLSFSPRIQIRMHNACPLHVHVINWSLDTCILLSYHLVCNISSSFSSFLSSSRRIFLSQYIAIEMFYGK
jgi:hypothetical protein